jgi:SepF-like predicted cell division protein (DUF552 family)
MSIFSKLKKAFEPKENMGEEYIEIDVQKDAASKAKIAVRPFLLKEYDDVSKILEILREGSTIALIDIKALKNKDIVELKRAIAKLKKTTDAVEGNIAGFGENIIIITPSYAKIHRAADAAHAAFSKVEKL